MRINLPYSRTKRHLTGIDWVISALDDQNRRITGGSNASQIVLELEGPVSEPEFRRSLHAFVQLFPVLAGRVARDWRNLAPYWRMPRNGSPIPVSIDIVHPAPGEAPLDAAARCINTGFSKRGERIAFRLISCAPDRHFLAMRFDHRLFDAHGAELFLDLFERWRDGRVSSAAIAYPTLVEPAHLSDWMRKFEAGKPFVRKLRELSQCPFSVIPRPANLRNGGFRFHRVSFDPAETAAITRRADQEAGFLMFSCYALAAAVQSLAPAFPGADDPKRELLVSFSMDARPTGAGSDTLFFNHLSFLLFRVPLALASDRPALMTALRTDLYEQTKAGFPQNLAESTLLMRILPASLFGRLMLLPLRGELASFGFACVGKGGFAQTACLGATVTNLFHMPLIPTPPGLAMVVNRFRDRMNVVLCHPTGMLDDSAAQGILARVRKQY